MKADVAYKLIRCCIETIETFLILILPINLFNTNGKNYYFYLEIARNEFF